MRKNIWQQGISEGRRRRSSCSIEEEEELNKVKTSQPLSLIEPPATGKASGMALLQLQPQPMTSS